MLIHADYRSDEKNNGKPAKRKSAVQTGGSSYGGFSAKWEYESYRQRKDTDSPVLRRATLVLTCGLIFGIGILIAVVALIIGGDDSGVTDNGTGTAGKSVSATVSADGTYSTVNTANQTFGEEFSDESEDGEGFRFGITGCDVDRDTANRYRLPTGILVTEVLEGMPAESMGLRENDIILSVDGARVYGMENLIRSLAGYTGNEGIAVTVYRGDGEKNLRYTPEVD